MAQAVALEMEHAELREPLEFQVLDITCAESVKTRTSSEQLWGEESHTDFVEPE